MNNVMIGGIGAAKKPKVKSVEIRGARWFDKTYGNTYHAKTSREISNGA